MKILTANIAYGLSGMDRFFSSLKHQMNIHGWGILTYELLPLLRDRMGSVAEEKRVDYIKTHYRLEGVLEMIRRTSPDMLVLNEVIYEVYRDNLERELQKQGFRTMAWGVGMHYRGASISTLVATRLPGIPIPCALPQRPAMGGGAGMAGIRLEEEKLSIFGMHLTYRSPALFKKQIHYVAQAAQAEKASGRHVLLAGDWNERESEIVAQPEFNKLDLISADANENLTCPTFLPRFLQKPLDHVFIPSSWQRAGCETMAFGSDHLALLAEIFPSLGQRD